MGDQEVESILSEIRQRVLSEQRAGKITSVSAAPSTIGNGESGSADSFPGEVGTPAPEALALIRSYLTTTARAWDRLPPLVSNRSGVSARLELWLKGHVKRATRWYAWEQVNFNAAVHHGLRDILEVLSAYASELESLRAAIGIEIQAREQQWEKHDAVLKAQRAEIESQLKAQRAEIESQRCLIDKARLAIEAQGSGMTTQLAAVAVELREADERLLDEQRVCFSQLSLETSEAAVIEDRARRKTEALIEELSRRLETERHKR